MFIKYEVNRVIGCIRGGTNNTSFEGVSKEQFADVGVISLISMLVKWLFESVLLFQKDHECLN